MNVYFYYILIENTVRIYICLILGYLYIVIYLHNVFCFQVKILLSLIRCFFRIGARPSDIILCVTSQKNKQIHSKIKSKFSFLSYEQN